MKQLEMKRFVQKGWCMEQERLQPERRWKVTRQRSRFLDGRKKFVLRMIELIELIQHPSLLLTLQPKSYSADTSYFVVSDPGTSWNGKILFCLCSSEVLSLFCFQYSHATFKFNSYSDESHETSLLTYRSRIIHLDRKHLVFSLRIYIPFLSS